MNFVFKSARQVMFESFMLGKKLYDLNIRPNHAISLWRGGTIVGIGINEYFRLQGVFINHTAITTSTYSDNFTQKEVIVKGLEHVIKVVVPEDILLIIDDIYDTGETISHLLSLLKNQTRKNMPHQVIVATLDRKPKKNLYNTNLVYLNDYDEDIWVNYPHEISDLINESKYSILKENNLKIYELLNQKSYPQLDLNIEDDYVWLTPEKIQEDSIKLGVNIFYSDFEPDFLIALWPGGVISGIYIHETYKYLNKINGNPKKNPDHVALNTASSHLSYKSNIIGLPYLLERIEDTSKILIIDTTFKAGIYVNPVVDKLKEGLRRNLNHKNIKVASVYFDHNSKYTWTTKPNFDKPHYYLSKVDKEIIYPHSIHKLNRPRKEVKERYPELYDIIYKD
ncbi:MAG: hypothetical protein ACK4YF_02935 [Exilispira sp.]